MEVEVVFDHLVRGLESNSLAENNEELWDIIARDY